MGFCSKCGAPIREGADKCWNCGESEPLTVTDPDGQVRNVPYVPRKVKNHRGCVLIVVVALIILAVLEMVPLCEIEFFESFPTLSTVLKMTEEPYYSAYKNFVDFIMVLVGLNVVSLIGGIFKVKLLPLFASVIAILHLLQFYLSTVNDANDFSGGLMHFTIGYWIILVANAVIMFSAMMN